MSLQDRFRDLQKEQELPLGLCAGCVQEGGQILPAVMNGPVQITVNGVPAVLLLGLCGDRHRGALAPPAQSPSGLSLPGAIPGIPLQPPS